MGLFQGSVKKYGKLRQKGSHQESREDSCCKFKELVEKEATSKTRNILLRFRGKSVKCHVDLGRENKLEELLPVNGLRRADICFSFGLLFFSIPILQLWNSSSCPWLFFFPVYFLVKHVIKFWIAKVVWMMHISFYF